MFGGLMSRWMMPASCTAARPRQSCFAICRPGERAMAPFRSRMSRSVVPGTYSIVRNLRPSASPRSCVRTTLRCVIFRASRISCLSVTPTVRALVEGFGQEDLDGDFVVELAVEGAVDRSHAALAERPEDLVAPREDRPRARPRERARRRVGRGGRRRASSPASRSRRAAASPRASARARPSPSARRAARETPGRARRPRRRPPPAASRRDSLRGSRPRLSRALARGRAMRRPMAKEIGSARRSARPPTRRSVSRIRRNAAVSSSRERETTKAPSVSSVALLIGTAARTRRSPATWTSSGPTACPCTKSRSSAERSAASAGTRRSPRNASVAAESSTRGGSPRLAVFARNPVWPFVMPRSVFARVSSSGAATARTPRRRPSPSDMSPARTGTEATAARTLPSRMTAVAGMPRSASATHFTFAKDCRRSSAISWSLRSRRTPFASKRKTVRALSFSALSVVQSWRVFASFASKSTFVPGSSATLVTCRRSASSLLP